MVMSPSSRLCLLVTTVTPAGLTATADVIPAAALSPPASTRQLAADWLAADSCPPMSVQLLSSVGKVRAARGHVMLPAPRCALSTSTIQPSRDCSLHTTGPRQLSMSPYTRGEPWLIYLNI